MTPDANPKDELATITDACAGMTGFYQRAHAKYAYAEHLSAAKPTPPGIQATAYSLCITQVEMLHEWQVNNGHFALACVTRRTIEYLLEEMRHALDEAGGSEMQ